MKEAKNKRCVCYIRVSTQEQVEGYSLSEQEERLNKYCAAMNWDCIKIYSDAAFSGSNMNRPALQELIAAVNKKEVDVVLVDKLDRLSRSQFDTLYMIQKVFLPNDVAFVSRAESFDTSTPFGRAMIGILAVFAELERERIKERMQEGKEGRIKEGKFRGGNTVPFGYYYNEDEDILKKDEYEAMILQEIYQMAADRMPLSGICRILEEKGYQTKNGGKWQDLTLKGILSNEIYLGKQKYHGKIYDANHEAIISQDLFNAVQKVMDERKITNAKYKAGRKYNSPLGGILWCECCGAKYQWKKARNKAHYICYSRSKSDSKLVKNPDCKNTTYNDKALEAAIYAEILKLKSDKTYIPQVKNTIDYSENIRILEKKISEIERKISKYMDLYAADAIDIDIANDKIRPLNQEKESMKNQIMQMQEESASLSEEEILSFVDVFEQAIQENDSSAIHDAIIQLIDWIGINGDTISIHWNF